MPYGVQARSKAHGGPAGSGILWKNSAQSRQGHCVSLVSGRDGRDRDGRCRHIVSGFTYAGPRARHRGRQRRGRGDRQIVRPAERRDLAAPEARHCHRVGLIAAEAVDVSRVGADDEEDVSLPCRDVPRRLVATHPSTGSFSPTPTPRRTGPQGCPTARSPSGRASRRRTPAHQAVLVVLHAR